MSRPDRRTIETTRNAYHRGARQLDRMQREWERAGGVCCPGCMFGEQWFSVYDKQRRRAVVLGIDPVHV